MQARPYGTEIAPIICGHRGAAAVEPENTLASFAAAIERGATWVEFDVRPTADDRLVIHHDPDTADGTSIGAAAYVELDPSIPTFGQLVAAQPTVGLDIEVKTDGVERDLSSYVELVAQQIETHLDVATATDPSRLIVTSFDVRALAMFRSLRPEVPTGLLFFEAGVPAVDIAIDAGHTAIAPWYKLVTADLVASAHEAGLGVATWTVNDKDAVRSVAGAGVDMIIGDDPATIVDALAPST